MGLFMIPTQPYDGIERGLLGYFVNASIDNQYEFVLQHWVNDGEFAGAVRLNPKSMDPIVGTQDPAESIFVIPQANGAAPIEIKGFSGFLKQRRLPTASCPVLPRSSSFPGWID